LDGVKGYIEKYHDYLQAQIGNPQGEDKPNKKYYDPRKWLRSGEESMRDRLKTAFGDLNCIDKY
jgi:fructose-bisphosphate aldolase class II